LHFNERKAIDAKGTPDTKAKLLESMFPDTGIEVEYYTPPGLDIGASCGQFLLDYYKAK
jgi:hypothetical protein